MGLNRFQEQLVDLVCEECGADRDKIFSQSKLREVVFARHMCYNVLFIHTPITFTKLGIVFNKASHSSVSIAMMKFQDLIDTSKKHAAIYADVVKKVKEMKDEKRLESGY